MNSRQLLTVIGGAQEEYIAAAMATREAEPKPRRLSLNRAVLIAAVIALTLLLVGCAVVYVLNLRDMKMGEFTFTQPRHLDENGNKVYETEITRDVVSLHGLVGSPNYLAAKEWYEFESAYDQDYALLHAADENPIDVPWDYDAYFVYTQEMIDKVDEIAEKYGLKLAGQSAPCQREEADFFFDSLGLKQLHRSDAQAEVTFANGYFYACGNFKAEFFATLTGGNAGWPWEVLGCMLYHDKGYFDTAYAQINSIETCEQWNYTLADGQTVLIVLDNDHAQVFCDREDAFLYLSFDITHGNDSYMTREDVQRIVDVFDFSVKPRKPDMEKVNVYLEKSYQEALARRKAEQATYVDPFALESYAEYVKLLIQKTENPESLLYGRSVDELYYCILDLDGDGTEDFLWGVGGVTFSEAVTMADDGTTELLFCNGIDSYLCEDGVIDQSSEYEGALRYSYIRLTGIADYKELANVQYDPGTGNWTKATYDDWGSWEVITEEEAMQIVNSYTRIDMGMKPLSTFPME